MTFSVPLCSCLLIVRALSLTRAPLWRTSTQCKPHCVDARVKDGFPMRRASEGANLLFHFFGNCALSRIPCVGAGPSG